MELIVMKTLLERSQTGVNCREVVGIYASSVAVSAYDIPLCKAQLKPWVTAYIDHIKSPFEIGYSEVSCSDPNCLFGYQLFEIMKDGSFAVFEILYFMKRLESPV